MRNALFTLAFLFAVTCRFGSAFVMPGDVVLGPDRGVIFNNAQCPMPNRVMATSPTPPQLIEQVVRTSETTRLRDESGHARLRAKVYTAGEIDGRWNRGYRWTSRSGCARTSTSFPLPDRRLKRF